MGNTEKKMILAVLSQCVADRDEATFAINGLLDKGFSHDEDNVAALKKEFKKLSQSELSIESIQIFYAKNFAPEPIVEPKKEETNDDNS